MGGRELVELHGPLPIVVLISSGQRPSERRNVAISSKLPPLLKSNQRKSLQSCSSSSTRSNAYKQNTHICISASPIQHASHKASVTHKAHHICNSDSLFSYSPLCRVCSKLDGIGSAVWRQPHVSMEVIYIWGDNAK